MDISDSVIAVFDGHHAAEYAIANLSEAGIEIEKLSVIGKGYHTEENVIGFYNNGERVAFWGAHGAFWGALWNVFFGGFFLTIPVVGHVVVVGHLVSAAVAAVEGAAIGGGVSALAAALYSVGIPLDRVIQYETAVKSDGFLVMVHGTAEDIAYAKTILGTANPSRIDVHAHEQTNWFSDAVASVGR